MRRYKVLPINVTEDVGEMAMCYGDTAHRLYYTWSICLKIIFVLEIINQSL